MKSSPDERASLLASVRTRAARLSARFRPGKPEGALDRLEGVGEADAPEGFDPDFYRQYYPDLTAVADDAKLRAHYIAYGRLEGRHANEQAYYAAIQKKLGLLPEGFDADEYWKLHADLRAKLKTRWEAAEHYLLQGRVEKRRYYAFDADLYRQAYFDGMSITDNELAAHFKSTGRPEGRTATWAAFLAEHGASPGTWHQRLKTDEFELLNYSWTGPVTGKLQAVRLFLTKGLARLAPMAFDAQFDIGYYREVHPEFAALPDEAVYRDWVFSGLGKAWPGSADQHLKREGLSLRSYPVAFDWVAYCARHGLSPANRWWALEHLAHGDAAAIASATVKGEGAAELYQALGYRHRGHDEAAAVLAFDLARRAGDESAASRHQQADALLRQGRHREALRLYREAALDPQSEMWTYINGAKAAVALGAFRAAADLLAQGIGLVSGHPAWREAVENLIEAFFAARTRQARRLYAFEGGRARADAAIARTIDQVADLWRRLDPVGAPVPVFPARKIVVLANHDIRVCVHYRVDQKMQQLDYLGREYAFYRLDQWREFLADLPGAAAAIFFRLPAWPSVVRTMLAARALEVPTYYEIDDLIFDADEYPDTLESYGGLLDAKEYETFYYGVPIFRAALTFCDYGIASTTPLARAMAPLVRTGEVFVVPNGLDDRNESFLTQPPAGLRRDDGLIIAYASGTKAHNSDFNTLAGPALVDVLKRHPHVKFLLVGYLALDPAFDALRDRILRFEYVDNSQTFWSLLAEADVNLAVLVPTWATDSKSEIKWLEAAVMGVPSIVSETAMYREVLEDEVDALIVRDVDGWRAALERMVVDADLRARIGEAARLKAEARYSIAAVAAKLEAALAPADARRRPLPVTREGRKPRVLLCNVWFPPQTIGGATRVLHNNLDAWLDSPVAEQFEFAVVCTDDNAVPPYRLRVDAYRGVPVFRISVPIERNMDWRPIDPEVGAIFTDVLRSWRPDLVHVHAIQRLTASILQAAQAEDVPYLATVHDAWWVSDYHFLVDEEGRRYEPCEAIPTRTPAGVSFAQSMDRRRLLSQALENAQAVLGVSETFTAIYRNCGFEQAIAVPNGLPLMNLRPRVMSSNGRVRLAHVGNVSKHKGYHLVQAALIQSDFADLELTVIDHGRAGGWEERLIWGSTPVRIIGKLPQDHIQSLYARTDVLLAPSIWPESYGLVAREALAAGCRVVASDLGAMGEDVTPGVNGWVIDVSTVEDLLAALAEINADPQRFTQPPPPVHLRSAQRQADELISLYRRVLADPRPTRAFARVATLRPEPSVLTAAERRDMERAARGRTRHRPRLLPAD